MKFIRASVCCAALLTTSAQAQRLTGTVRDSASSGVVTGAVVVLVDAENKTIARALTNASGQYVLDLNVAARKVRVVRIGFRPRVIDIAGLSTQSPLDVRMQRLSTLLAAVEVNDDQVCSKDVSRLEALSLWEQARAGLLAAIVAREANPATTRLIGYDRQIDNESGRVILQNARLTEGRTTKPFVAASDASVFAEEGYARSLGTSTEFFAPDEDVLLHESFARTHCFTVRKADGDHPDALGLAFEPVKGRDKIVDVKGVLWLEASTPGLRSIEYRYTGPNEVLTSSDSRGTIHFVTMPNGVTFIDEWLSHLPVFTDRPFMQPTGPTVRRGAVEPTVRRITQFGETGGIVVEASWPDGSSFKSPLEPLSGTVTEERTHRPVANVMVAIGASRDTVLTDSLGRWAIYPLFPGKYEITVADTVMESFVEPRVQKREVTVARAGKNVLNAQVPSRMLAIKRLCHDTAIADRHAILLGRIANTDEQGSLPKDLRVHTSWLSDHMISLNRTFSALFDTQGFDVDNAGRFSACGAPTEKAIRLTLTRGRATVRDTLITIDRPKEIEQFVWPVSVASMAGARELKQPSLVGRVVADNVPVSGVEVWLPALGRRTTTDDAGQFRIDTVPSGLLLIQLRKVGSVAKRDTVTLSLDGPPRTFSLTTQGTALEPVRAATAASGGYVIPDSVLRQQDDKALSSIISANLPGLTLIPGRMGSVLMLNGDKKCFVSVYIDGIRIYSTTMRGSPPPDASQIKVSELAGVEYYANSGIAPPQYKATDSACGVLLLWTRER